MTTMWILPVVTLIVASASGGILGRAIQVYSQLHAFQTLVVCIFMATVGFTLAMMMLTVYLLRLITHGLPPNPRVLSVFIQIGPTSQSGYAILLIGQNFEKLLPLPSQSYGFLNSSSTGMIVEVFCICLSFLLWSLATMWILYALLAIYSALRQSRIAFRVSFWALIHPNVILIPLSFSTFFTEFTSFFLLGRLRKLYDPTRHYIRFRSVANVGILLCHLHIISLVEHRHSVLAGVEEYLRARKCFPSLYA